MRPCHALRKVEMFASRESAGGNLRSGLRTSADDHMCSLPPFHCHCDLREIA